MIWVFVFGGIAVVGLIMVVAYAIWLVHKAADVFAELKVLGQRMGTMAEIVGRIEVPELGAGPERVTVREQAPTLGVEDATDD